MSGRFRAFLARWRSWLWPLITLISLYMVFRLVFGIESGAFLSRRYIQLQPGEVPEVQYEVTVRGALVVSLCLMFVAAFILSLRQWARYYLNRKLMLSYLIFAFVPLSCTVVIFVLLIRSLFGITAVNTVENTMILLSNDLAKYARSVHDQTTQLLNDPEVGNNVEILLARIIEETRETELRRHSYSDIVVDVYLQSTPNTTNTFVCLFCETLKERGQGTLTGIQSLDADAYQNLFPEWFDGADHMAIIERNNSVFVQHYSVRDYQGFGNIVVVARVPIDADFLDHIRDTMDINIRLTQLQGYWSFQTTSDDDAWYLRWLFRPLSSTWELRTLDWKTGIYHHTADMTFDIAPGSILASLGRVKDQNFFGNDQKKAQFYLILGITLFLIFAVLMAFVFGFYLISFITRSLNQIAAGHEEVARGRFDFRLPYLGRDQLGAMGRSFNAMVNNIATLLGQVREKEKYEEELRIARDIQMSLLPDMHKVESRNRISAICIPARQVGGDYYDIFETASGRVGIFIADVSGKGTSAAFYMAELKGVLIALRHLWDKPRELMLTVNEILYPALSANVFISAAYVLLDGARRKGTLARAGHCPALHITDGACNDLMPPGMAIGLARNHIFGKIMEPVEFAMDPDDKVVLFTDGLDEMTRQGELYGMKRLREVLVDSSNMTSEEIRDAVLTDVRGFVANGEQNDDLTLVVASLPDRKISVDTLPKTG